jgi:hypothetical protein
MLIAAEACSKRRLGKGEKRRAHALAKNRVGFAALSRSYAHRFIYAPRLRNCSLPVRRDAVSSAGLHHATVTHAGPMRACVMAVAALHAKQRQRSLALCGPDATRTHLRLRRCAGADKRAQGDDGSKQRRSPLQPLDHDFPPVDADKCGASLQGRRPVRCLARSRRARASGVDRQTSILTRSRDCAKRNPGMAAKLWHSAKSAWRDPATVLLHLFSISDCLC